MAAGKSDHPLERLVFFSDAVFAIAITLLVIEIHPPHLDPAASDSAHWRAIGDLWPQYLGYLISFFVIGLFWMGHHRAFTLATHYDPRVLRWNLMLLATIAFMPFVTANMSANYYSGPAVQLYCAAMLVAAMLNYKVNRTATRPPMLGPDATPEAVANVRARGLGVMMGAATALAASLLVPRGATAFMATIPLWQRLLVRMLAKAPAAA
jgi:uncharacterized membrane protein